MDARRPDIAELSDPHPGLLESWSAAQDARLPVNVIAQREAQVAALVAAARAVTAHKLAWVMTRIPPRDDIYQSSQFVRDVEALREALAPFPPPS